MQRINQPTNDIKPSMTALSVAMAFLRSLNTEHEYLFTKRELELLTYFCELGKQSLTGFNWVLGNGISTLSYAMQQSFFNYAVVPGYDQIIMLRKLMVKNKIENAIQNGTKQVVFLGGGYDIRAFITSLDYPEVNIYELDRGATRENKLTGLKKIPTTMGFNDINFQELSADLVRLNNNLYYVSCDFSENNLVEKLYEHGFSKEKKTLIIAEGLTMYLSKDENERLLLSIANILGDDDEVLLSYMSELSYSKITEVSLKSSNELYRFSLHPEKVIPFVEDYGYQVNGKFVATTMLKQIGDLSAAHYHQDHPNYRKEYYYLLKKSSNFKQNMRIDNVPNIDVDIIQKPVPKEKDASCCVM